MRGLLTVVGARENLGGMAMVQEVRDALRAFRTAAAGRSAPTVACAAAYGEAGLSGTVPLYLASACSRVYVQPSGLVSFSGLESTGIFLRGLLDKIKASRHTAY